MSAVLPIADKRCKIGVLCAWKSKRNAEIDIAIGTTFDSTKPILPPKRTQQFRDT